MIIASRTLRLILPSGAHNVRIDIFQPEEADGSWTVVILSAGRINHGRVRAEERMRYRRSFPPFRKSASNSMSAKQTNPHNSHGMIGKDLAFLSLKTRAIS